MKMNATPWNVGFDLKLERGPLGRPSSLSLWNKAELFKKNQPGQPFKYCSDALLGVSAHWLTLWSREEKSENLGRCEEYWKNLDPHFEMALRSRERVLALRKEAKSMDRQALQIFEKSFLTSLKEAFQGDRFEYDHLFSLVETVDYLETQTQAPLLFNFSISFSEEFRQALQYLYSFLWNTRALVAVDHNAHIEDASHEALRMDSISDYLPKPEYVVNDALLYHQYKKVIKPFISGKNSDVRLQKLLIDPLDKAFHQFSHNASYLIDHLPERFLNSMGPLDLEEALYLVQMDWLLGAESGLLFKVREEIFGLQNGYEKIFWTEWEGAAPKKTAQLSASCALTPGMLKKNQVA